MLPTLFLSFMKKNEDIFVHIKFFYMKEYFGLSPKKVILKLNLQAVEINTKWKKKKKIVILVHSKNK